MEYLGALQSGNINDKQVNQLCEYIFKNMPISNLVHFLETNHLERNDSFLKKLFIYQMQHANSILDWQLAKIPPLPTSHSEFVNRLPEYMVYLTPSLLTQNQELHVTSSSESCKLLSRSPELSDSKAIFEKMIQPALKEAITQAQESHENQRLLAGSHSKAVPQRSLYQKVFLDITKYLIENTNWNNTFSQAESEIQVEGTKKQVPPYVANIYQQCLHVSRKNIGSDEAFKNIKRLAASQTQLSSIFSKAVKEEVGGKVDAPEEGPRKSSSK